MVLVVIKTFDILELVALRNGQAVTLTEIGAELNLNQATAANIIKTMVHKGYLEHIGKKKGYRLGPATYRLTNEVSYEQELVEAARPVMEELTAELNESSILGTLRNYKRYILHVVNSTQEVQVQVRTERNVYETASGRLLIAYLPEKELERFLQQNGLPDRTLWKEAITHKSLQLELAKIKKDGIVKTHVSNRHVRGFAVPVFADEKVVAGLSVFLPDYRCTPSRQRLIIQQLRKASGEISDRLRQGG
ncbi:MAG TPA: IclR family transcriptional regulator [Flavisolibacter sp.]|nr:IclR family transcriptional regulator [Flavisolibacter sp.]